MTKIVLPDKMTIGERYERCAKIIDQHEADEYFLALVERNLRIYPEHDLDEAIKVEKSNIGYYAGYFSSQTALRMELLFNTQHPILGSAKNYYAMSTEEIIEAGYNFAKNTPTPPPDNEQPESEG